ncbi:efflux transporter periplasmic adaptor subunit [Pseudoalteromonas luteoviolacea]|uniref:Efflux transporter periplasmic adaptor subunit n=1 Tax=Pseudoalteromonas luteoviolacea TaxID=43657 RepID=A0A1C0TMU4_9GAMM|nr:efflux RND transporter periplasmic adaptor subunit [Pseudoalteromonas luteoviolacea]MBQ4811996.1 efflux RND transporter periplasmic adaptor subunit [Pseudoalteromonas luteoviolacea]OCQ20132.1 efflux transporter periplasmic adaptor subunit [Pseudoalteromonas luteoviolacea]
MRANQSGKTLFPAFILMLIALCGYLYFPASQGDDTKRQAKPVQVVVYKASTQNREITLNAIGSARANQAINITSSHSDYIDELMFSDGQAVSRGQKLAQLQNQQELLAVKELTINLKEQQRQLVRLTELAKTQSTARSQLDTQRSKVDALSTQLQATKLKLAEMEVYAPFDGILGKRLVSIGSYVDDNTPLTTLDDISTIKVDFQLPEKYLAQLSLGMQTSVTNAAYQDTRFIGQISHIDPRIDETTRSIQITADFKNSDLRLRPGMLLNVAVQLQQLNALILPEKSIIPRQDRHYVYVVEDSKVKQQQVTLLNRFTGWVAVDGLQPGQLVITEGTTKVRNGSPVTVKG